MLEGGDESITANEITCKKAISHRTISRLPTVIAMNTTSCIHTGQLVLVISQLYNHTSGYSQNLLPAKIGLTIHCNNHLSKATSLPGPNSTKALQSISVEQPPLYKSQLCISGPQVAVLDWLQDMCIILLQNKSVGRDSCTELCMYNNSGYSWGSFKGHAQLQECPKQIGHKPSLKCTKPPARN